MQLLEEQEAVPFLRIQTLFFQLMPFRDVGDPLAVDRDSSEVTVLSVVGLMKEAIAQRMVPSVTNAAVLIISSKFVILGMPIPARSKEGRVRIRRKASSETDGHRGTTKAKAKVEEEVHQGRRNRSTRTRRKHTLSHLSETRSFQHHKKLKLTDTSQTRVK